jgi:hypothetical protein
MDVSFVDVNQQAPLMESLIEQSLKPFEKGSTLVGVAFVQ